MLAATVRSIGDALTFPLSRGLMKARRYAMSFLLVAAFILGALAQPVSAAPNRVVVFPDPALNQAIHAALGIPLGQDVYQSDLLTLTELDGVVGSITDISGLEYCTNLRRLELSQNGGLRDLSALSKLDKLEHLGLFLSGVSDLRPLKNLTSLQYLNLAWSSVSDISPLLKLKNLHTLYLGNNFIADIRPLVKNRELGTGDYIVLTNNPLDTEPGSRTMEGIQTLISRGATVLYPPYPNLYP